MAQGRFPPDSLVNVRVIPRTTPVRDVINMMRGFTGALGVRCPYCHVGQEGQDLSTFNFPSDSLRTKRTARLMIQMVRRINDSTLAQIPDRPAPNVAVTCTTCHRGVARPVPLTEILGQAAASSGGVDSATRAYRALREQYYGRAAYDFGENTLMGAAFPLLQQRRQDDALVLLRLNLEFFPNSAPTLATMGDAYLGKADTASAISLYRQALARDPNAQQARQRLRQLGQS